MASSRVIKVPLVRKRRRRGKGARRFLRRWHGRARWARRKFAAAPRTARIAVIGVGALALFSATNLVYHVARKPTELLAALAQVESAGNPVARTYWRWRLSWNPLAIYQPASSAVGTYQMTDAA